MAPPAGGGTRRSQTAVGGAMAVSIGMLLLTWWLIGLGQRWVYYFFNIWVSLFSVCFALNGKN